MQVPSNMIMSSARVRPSIYMAVCMMAWAVVSACTALAKNYTGLVLVRFFLGVAEAPFYPGAIYMLSIFYTRKEIAARLSILYSGNIFATSFSGLIAAAVFNTVDGAQGIRGWQWLFIIEGVVTFAVAIAGMFLLADSPLTTRWLTPEERQLAHDRMVLDTVGLAESKGSRAGFMQAVRDPRLWLLCFIQNCHFSTNSQILCPHGCGWLDVSRRRTVGSLSPCRGVECVVEFVHSATNNPPPFVQIKMHKLIWQPVSLAAGRYL